MPRAYARERKTRSVSRGRADLRHCGGGGQSSRNLEKDALSMAEGSELCGGVPGRARRVSRPYRTEIRRRAIDGWDEPVVYQGVLTGAVVRKYSDRMLELMAKAY